MNINGLRESIESGIEFHENYDKGKWGIYYKDKRIGFTGFELVAYSTKEKAYQAMLQHGKHKWSFRDKDGNVSLEEYKKAVDELLKSDLEIKQL